MNADASGMSGACPLLGLWDIARTVCDMRAGHDAVFTGLARIAPGPESGAPGIVWHEEGDLVTAGHSGRARRVMRIVPDAGAWLVLFEDGRPFHPLDLSGGRCEVVHLCGADRYEGRFDMPEADAFAVRWRVRGPAKDLEIVSGYRRSADDDGPPAPA